MFTNYLKTFHTAGSIVFSRRKYLGLAVATFLLAAVFYAFTLPATYTGGHVGLISLRYLTPLLTAFSVVMAGLVAMIVSFSAYSLRLGASASTTTTTTGLLGSVLPPILCCSSLLPTVAAVFVGVFPGAFGISGLVQGFIATYEIEILAGAAVVLLYAVLQNAKGVTQCTT